jgi:hypothetical protein
LPGKKRRVLLKLSGEAFGGGTLGVNPDIVAEMAREIAEGAKHAEVAIVVGGGNFFRGAELSQRGMDRSRADYMGMLGTVMNALALQDFLEQAGVDIADIRKSAAQAQQLEVAFDESGEERANAGDAWEAVQGRVDARIAARVGSGPHSYEIVDLTVSRTDAKPSYFAFKVTGTAVVTLYRVDSRAARRVFQPIVDNRR